MSNLFSTLLKFHLMGTGKKSHGAKSDNYKKQRSTLLKVKIVSVAHGAENLATTCYGFRNFAAEVFFMKILHFEIAGNLCN